MADNLSPGLGTVLSVCATLPANELAATYEALTWIVVGEVTEIPSFGPEHDVVTHVPLATGITAKYHGALNNGSITVPMGLDKDDTGQTALKTALGSKARIAYQVSYADGTADFFQGKVMSFQRGASIGEVISAEVMIEIETTIVEGDAS